MRRPDLRINVPEATPSSTPAISYASSPVTVPSSLPSPSPYSPTESFGEQDVADFPEDEKEQSVRPSAPEPTSKPRLMRTPVTPQDLPTAVLPPAYTDYKRPRPTTALLFSALSTKDKCTLLFPAICISLVLGGSAPFMTQVIGEAFDAFANFPVTGATSADASTLFRSVGITSAELGGLAVGVMAVSCTGSSLWVRCSERVCRTIRERVFVSVVGREMQWFDMQATQEGGDINAGGMQAKFTEDTEHVRIAISQRFPQVIEHLTTTLIALVLAFVRSPLLSLLILSAIPVMLISDGTLQRFSSKDAEAFESLKMRIPSFLSSTLDNIATVKVYNGAEPTISYLTALLGHREREDNRQSAFWAVRQGTNKFIISGTFVTAFWFGARLVQEGKLSPGSVMSVFWACLIASSNAQMLLEPVAEYLRGKEAMVRLVELVEPGPIEMDETAYEAALAQGEEDVHEEDLPPYEFPRHSSFDGQDVTDERDLEAGLPTPRPRPRSLVRSLIDLTVARKPSRAFSTTSVKTFISRPSIASMRSQTRARVSSSSSTCNSRSNQPKGAIDISHLTFFYPSRPWPPALEDVSVFFPAGELTFVVGGSGSGKSTLATLLVGMYNFPPVQDNSLGVITVDGVPLIDGAELRERAALVQFGGGVVFDMSVRDNVCIAASDPSNVSDELVQEALRMAMMHEWVEFLPGKLGCLLGESAAGQKLSGGQQQRLALARARVRDPEVLILDEATSHLDISSRFLVFSALRHWRRGKTTIVITHDLSELSPSSFAYVLKDGRVVEQGFRRDLEQVEGGEFARMAAEQAGGCGAATQSIDDEEYGWQGWDAMAEEAEDTRISRWRKHTTMQVGHLKNAISDLLHRHPEHQLGDQEEDRIADREQTPSPLPKHRSRFLPFLPRPKRASALPQIPYPRRTAAPEPEPFYNLMGASLESISDGGEDATNDYEVEYLRQTGAAVRTKRRAKSTHSERRRWTDYEVEQATKEIEIVVQDRAAALIPQPDPVVPAWTVIKRLLPLVPHKWVLVLSLFSAVANGATTPLFSFFLARLLAQVALGAEAMDFTAVTIAGCTVLGVIFGDGLTMALKIFGTEYVGHAWLTKIRSRMIGLVMKQDKTWHDENPYHKVVPVVENAATDVSELIAQVAPQFVTAATMLGGAMVWAVIIGWQLALVGFGLAPLFVLAAVGQFILSIEAQRVGAKSREVISEQYCNAIRNIRAIRGLGLEETFRKQFVLILDSAVKTGISRAWLVGCAFGLLNALIFISEAVLFLVAAKLVSVGLYTYGSMVQVMTLVVFSITNGAQVLQVIPVMTKAIHAAGGILKLLDLEKSTPSDASETVELKTDGVIRFQEVEFAYKSRAENPILKQVNFEINPGECVALVGSSGCGKTTVIALLQRLYEPISGNIWLDQQPLWDGDASKMRRRIAVVTQQTAVFPTSVKENISYGRFDIPLERIVAAAKDANSHDFIMQLPEGYDTPIGKGNGEHDLSEGQKQRLGIARALVREADIYIFDECTASLDALNESAILKTLRAVTPGKTVVMITHKLQIMQMCDRILCLQDGEIAEQGSFDDLMARRGPFHNLTTAAEWVN
ncbi:P-loop containing nucleoside triphosphate hydrolase protein [Dacryopinax primogenitus]|uniref:p-loop containing nucleoside triphosphate hydrolase protein n=1 Tax=Dacryopinax primogenitus (strain DJM 731) TaxID=1858805 RepID=M5G021_DACPD|nr:P-loop containing nucleoside triphosphate hydrolase protein [Dacryopinax primogenitus]EJU01500.1 P-loop containing nucleoside triphosphate hydrolase protein [Dacryopinax primogenitus]